jgi:hypothetical protein
MNAPTQSILSKVTSKDRKLDTMITGERLMVQLFRRENLVVVGKRERNQLRAFDQNLRGDTRRVCDMNK